MMCLTHSHKRKSGTGFEDILGIFNGHLKEVVMRTVCILAVSFLFTFSGALAQENLSSDVIVPSEKDIVVDLSAESELLDESSADPGFGVRSIGDINSTFGKAPCWMSWDPKRNRFRLIVGSTYGIYGATERSIVLDNYFDSADCGWGAFTGTIPWGYDLDLSLKSAYLLDQTTGDGGRVYFQIYITKHCVDGCDGTCFNYSEYDQARCDSTIGDQYWREALDLEGDSDVCHRPDVKIPAGHYFLDATGLHGLKFVVRTWVCDPNGSSNCTFDSDSGCLEYEVVQ